MILSFDVGGTFIKWGVIKDNEIIEKGKIPTPQDTFKQFLSAIESIVFQFNVEGLAFSLPGTMNKEKTQIFVGGALRFNDQREFVKEVSEYFQLPVTMENDANSAALAEIEFGHLRHSENGLVIVVGTGIGCVYVHNGEIIRGSHGYGGEISFLPIKDLYQNPFIETLFEQHVGMRAFINKAKIQLYDDSLTGESFMELVKIGNEEASSLIDEYMKVFSQTIFMLQIVYDPDCIVIGGGISSNEVYMNLLHQYINKVFDMCPLKVPYATIESSTFYNDSNLIGAFVSYRKQRGEI